MRKRNPMLPPQSQRYGGNTGRPQVNQQFGSYNRPNVPMHYSDRNFEIHSQASNTSRQIPGRASPFRYQQPRIPSHGASGGSQLGGMSNYTASQFPGGGVPCPNHSEEFVSYFCFTCQCHPICAECVIHGEHQGHQVQTIRRAIP